jgi:hypothetical protein
MKINLNKKLRALGDAYHAGKLSKDDYRVQRRIEFERLNEQDEESGSELPTRTGKTKKHIMVSVVLFVISIFTIVMMVV